MHASLSKLVENQDMNNNNNSNKNTNVLQNMCGKQKRTFSHLGGE